MSVLIERFKQNEDVGCMDWVPFFAGTVLKYSKNRTMPIPSFSLCNASEQNQEVLRPQQEHGDVQQHQSLYAGCHPTLRHELRQRHPDTRVRSTAM